jgi:hypothetical protein
MKLNLQVMAYLRFYLSVICILIGNSPFAQCILDYSKFTLEFDEQFNYPEIDDMEATWHFKVPANNPCNFNPSDEDQVFVKDALSIQDVDNNGDNDFVLTAKKKNRLQ